MRGRGDGTGTGCFSGVVRCGGVKEGGGRASRGASHTAVNPRLQRWSRQRVEEETGSDSDRRSRGGGVHGAVV